MAAPGYPSQGVLYPKWLLVAGAFACLLVGFGGSFALKLAAPEAAIATVRAEVTQLAATQQRVLAEKADKVTVDLQYNTLLRELGDMKEGQQTLMALLRDHMNAPSPRVRGGTQQ